MTANVTRDITAFLGERVVPPGAGRYGLVIGIEQYRDARLNPRCAAAARAIFDLMIDPNYGMFPKENVRLLFNEEAMKDDVWPAQATRESVCRRRLDSPWEQQRMRKFECVLIRHVKP